VSLVTLTEGWRKSRSPARSLPEQVSVLNVAIDGGTLAKIEAAVSTRLALAPPDASRPASGS
jgi:hypothetical protein